MAKRIRVGAKRARVPSRARKTARASAKPRGPSPRRYVYTPELLALGRHRYEHTEDSITDIAVEFGIHKTTLQRLANREGWVRHAPPPRDLSEATRLLAQTAALESALDAPPPVQAQRREIEKERAAPSTTAAPSGASSDQQADIERLERSVRNELSVIEDMRARMRNRPQSPLDGERTARTLSSLTATLYKLQRMRCGLPENDANDYDDMPTDIDAFRRELARRIREFVASRRRFRDGNAAPGETDPLAEVRS